MTRDLGSASAANAATAATSRQWVSGRRVKTGQGLAARVESRHDQGSITLWVAATFMAIIAVAGLVVDGGARIRAGERADLVAGEAARAASFANGPDDTVRTSAAATAARGILTRSGLAGNVTVTGPGQVDIGVQGSATGPISGYTYSVTRNAHAQVLLGVRTGDIP